MKKGNRKSADETRPEYDFASMKGGVRGKYVSQYQSGTNIVVLDPAIAKAFPTDAAVNRALGALLEIMSAIRLKQRGKTSA